MSRPLSTTVINALINTLGDILSVTCKYFGYPFQSQSPHAPHYMVSLIKTVLRVMVVTTKHYIIRNSFTYLKWGMSMPVRIKYSLPMFLILIRISTQRRKFNFEYRNFIFRCVISKDMKTLWSIPWLEKQATHTLLHYNLLLFQKLL